MAGSARGRRLSVPTSGTHPTSDRAREAVFSSLESMRGGFNDAVVLDLFAGSGALGLEALSRGASHVDLVEVDRAAVSLINGNAEAVLTSRVAASPTAAPSAGARASVHAVSVERWLSRPVDGVRYDLVFCDPPYAVVADDIRAVVEALIVQERLAEGALVVVERGRRDPPWSWPVGLTAVWDRTYGEAHLWIGGAKAAVPPLPPAPGPPSDSVAPC